VYIPTLVQTCFASKVNRNFKMRFVQARSAVATYWPIATSAFESCLSSLGLAKEEASEEVNEEAIEDSLEPELPFLVPYVPSKADLQAQVLFSVLALQAGHRWSVALVT